MSLLSRIKTWLESRFAIPLDSKLAFSKKDFVTTEFTHGVEFFNGDTTKMEYVVKLLMKHFDLKKDDAVVAMIICHEYDSVVFPVDTIEQAEQIALSIMDEAREQNYPLECKSVSNQKDAPGDLPDSTTP